VKDRTLALCLVDPDNDFQQLLRVEAEAAAARAGFAAEVHHTGHDLAAQLRRLEALIGRPAPPDAILVLAVRDQGLAKLARDAVRAGISFVYLNRTEDDVEAVRRDAAASATAAVVCIDEAETGRIQARQYRRLLPEGGRVLYVEGSRRSLVARDRTAGLREAARDVPLELVTLEAGWTAAEARQAVRSWLGIAARGGLRLDLAGCQNDQIALGTLEALGTMARELGRPELARVPVAGCDGTPALGQKLVREGRLAATVCLPRSSGRAVECVARFLLHREAPPALVTLAAWSFPEEPSLRPLQRTN
jgi:ABC-type sugar transport system substrate-binding protein